MEAPSASAECVRVVVRCRPLNSTENRDGRRRIVSVDSELQQVSLWPSQLARSPALSLHTCLLQSLWFGQHPSKFPAIQLCMLTGREPSTIFVPSGRSPVSWGNDRAAKDLHL